MRVARAMGRRAARGAAGAPAPSAPWGSGVPDRLLFMAARTLGKSGPIVSTLREDRKNRGIPR
jgi:hypothetical protein